MTRVTSGNICQLRLVEELREQLGWYCAHLSTSMKFDTDVDQNILNSFFEGAKAGAHSGSPQSQNPIWPPADIGFCHNFVTKSRRIMSESSVNMFLTSRIPNLNSILT